MGVGLHKASVYLGGGLHVFTELPKRGLLTVLTAPLKTVDPKRSIRGLERRPLKMGSFGKNGVQNLTRPTPLPSLPSKTR